MGRTITVGLAVDDAEGHESNTLTVNLTVTGGAMWGYHHGTSTEANVEAFETTVGRKFAAIRSYYSIMQHGTWPTSDDLALANNGRLIYADMSFRWFGSTPGPITIGSATVPAPSLVVSSGPITGTYYDPGGQIATGACDPLLDQIITKIKAFPHTLWLSLGLEPDTDFQTLSNQAMVDSGYDQAFRYIVQRFRAQGVTNVKFCHNMAGFASDAINQQCYPGDDVVDLIGWDPYITSTTDTRTLTQLFSAYYTRLENGLLASVGPQATSKPYVLGEWGVTNGISNRPQVLEGVQAALTACPKIAALFYFDSTSYPNSSHPVAIQGSDSASVAAFTDAGHSTAAQAVPPT